MTQPDGVGRLTEEQHTRLAILRADLERARSTDVLAMSPSGLIMCFEHARGALDDAVRLLSEVVDD